MTRSSRPSVVSFTFVLGASLLGCAKTSVGNNEATARRAMGDKSVIPPVAHNSGQRAVALGTAVCGDGLIGTYEDCDDGNLTRGDGCSDSCRPEARLIRSSDHVCVILVTGEVKCWGDNHRGQLGYGDRNDRGDDAAEMGSALPKVDLGVGRIALELQLGWHHTCAILNDHSVKCWGRNDVGQLGYGDRKDRGDNTGEMGDALPTVDLGAGRKAMALALGALHSCALLDNGGIKCWGGGGSRRQLGYGGGESRGDDPDEMGNHLPLVDLGHARTATAVVAGDEYTCAMLNQEGVKCWGPPCPECYGYGKKNIEHMGDQLPTIDFGKGRSVVSLSAGRAHICAIFSTGGAGCWGDDSFGQLGDRVFHNDCAPQLPSEPLCRSTPPRAALQLGGEVAQIVARHDATCVVLEDGQIKCWGANACGQFGGDPSDSKCTDGVPYQRCARTAPAVPVHLVSKEPVESLALGSDVCVLARDRRVQCWGCYNDHGQLGYGDTKSRPQPTDEFVDY